MCWTIVILCSTCQQGISSWCRRACSEYSANTSPTCQLLCSYEYAPDGQQCEDCTQKELNKCDPLPFTSLLAAPTAEELVKLGFHQ